MNLFKDAMDNINKKKKKDKVKEIAAATGLGVALGAITTLFISNKAGKRDAPLYEARDNLADNALDAVDKGKTRVKQVKRDLKEAKKQLKKDKRKAKEEIAQGQEIIM